MGKIFFCTGAWASCSNTRGRWPKNRSFSIESFNAKLLMNVIVSTSLFENASLFSMSFFGLYRRVGCEPRRR